MFSLENYLKSVYYNTYPLMLYFQVQFMKVHYTENTKNAIKSLLRKERFSSRWERDLNARKRNYHDDSGKKKEKQLEKDIMIKRKP